jgi:condensin complex subunit 1
VNRLPTDHKQGLLHCLLRGINALNQTVTSASVPERQAKNAVRMFSYLLNLIVVASEDDALTSTSITGPTSKAKGAKGKKAAAAASAKAAGNWNWSIQRVGCIKGIKQILGCITEELWARKTPEPELVNLLNATCYKFMENVDVVKDADTKQLLFATIGCMTQQFRQAFGATTSILHLLSHFDHLIGPLAEFVQSMVVSFDGQSVVTELLREIGRNDPRELAQDSTGTRNIAGFLTELGNLAPMAILRSGGISVLLPHLNGESYPIRNAIISIMSGIVCQLVVDGESVEGAKKTREQFQEILEERILDTSAYVRGKALQLWCNMAAVEVPIAGGEGGSQAEEQLGGTAMRSSIPRDRQPALVALAADRLRDKSSIVRKEALRLLTTLLVRNPYGPKLPGSEWKAKSEVAATEIGALVGELFVQMQQKQAAESSQPAVELAKAKQEAKEKAAEVAKAANKDELDDSESDADELLGDEDDVDVKEEAEEEGAPMDEEEAVSSAAPLDSPEVQMAKLKYVFFSEGATFAEQMEAVMPIASDLLGSKNITDVKEAIAFIEAGSRYGIEAALPAVQKMLVLMWTKEAAVKTAVIEAYCRLFVNDRRAEAIANNMVQLTCGCNLGELTSLEEMVCELMSEEKIASTVIKALWAMFAGKGSTDSEHSVRALMVLGMCARSDSEIIRKNSGLLVSIGLGVDAETGTYNMGRVQYTCIALQKFQPEKVERGKTAEAVLFNSGDELFQRMVDAVTFDSAADVPGWHAAVEQAINTIFALAENPDKICGQIIAALSKPVFGAGAKPSSAQLARVVFVVGQIALKQLVHLEKIEGEMKRRLRLQEESDKSKSKDDKDDADDIVGGAAASDEIAEAMARLADNDLVLGNSMLGTFAPILVSICSHPEKYPDATLRSAAVLSLTKFMTVSSKFAEENLQLLFTIMQDATEPRIRANCVLAMGDLAVRFANLLEPWTSHMYGRLRDSDVTVRKNAVMVLTHLILNDMIKVKGQVSEMALRLEDDDERVGDLARLFFLELSHKDNAIYNMLPDVISQLASNPELEPAQFNRIMDYLMTFITKGMHCVSLVEKLCYRFRTTSETQQWRYFAHCLSLLDYNDRAIKKLTAQLACYQDTLADEQVYNSFVEIMAKAKKFSSADMKEALAELEAKLEEIHNKGQEDDEAFAKAGKVSKAVAKVKGKKGGKAANRKALEPVATNEDADGDAMDADASEVSAAGSENTAAPKRGGRSKGKATMASSRKARAIVDSDDDDAEDYMI